MMQQKLLNEIENNKSYELREAFVNFNEVSNQLTEVYMNLERQVEVLSSELISVRDERARELEQKERIANRLQKLLKVLPAGIVVLDKDGIIQEHNLAASELLGRSLLGEAWRTVVERAFTPRWDDGHDITLADGRCVNISTQSLEEEEGQLILLKETTETKRMQYQLDRLKRLSAMGDLASSLAHQVRTPLSTALLYASHLRRQHLTPELQERFVDKLMMRLKHLESLVEDMLLFAKGGKFDSRPLVFKLLIDDFVESIEPQISRASAEVIVKNNAPAITVDVNRNAIVSILHNLINNAIQAAREPVTIHITIRRSNNDMLALIISDNGPGIDNSIRNKIFEPFFTTREEGTGLGLTIVEAVIRAHGGQIKVEPGSGSGANFNIQLPIAN